jgi:hypothetical protein
LQDQTALKKTKLIILNLFISMEAPQPGCRLHHIVNCLSCDTDGKKASKKVKNKKKEKKKKNDNHPAHLLL